MTLREWDRVAKFVLIVLSVATVFIIGFWELFNKHADQIDKETNLKLKHYKELIDDRMRDHMKYDHGKGE